MFWILLLDCTVSWRNAQQWGRTNKLLLLGHFALRCMDGIPEIASRAYPWGYCLYGPLWWPLRPQQPPNRLWGLTSDFRFEISDLNYLHFHVHIVYIVPYGGLRCHYSLRCQIWPQIWNQYHQSPMWLKLQGNLISQKNDFARRWQTWPNDFGVPVAPLVITCPFLYRYNLEKMTCPFPTNSPFLCSAGFQYSPSQRKTARWPMHRNWG